MKNQIAKAPTYPSPYPGSTCPSSPGKKTPMDFSTMRQPNCIRKALRSKDPANCIEIGCLRKLPPFPMTRLKRGNSLMKLIHSMPQFLYATMEISNVFSFLTKNLC